MTFVFCGSGYEKDYGLLLSNTTHWNERLVKVRADKVHMFFEPVTIGREARLRMINRFFLWEVNPCG
jgi:hypothetical protein